MFFLLAMLALPSTAQERPVLRLVGDNWCPYNCDPKTGRNGYVVDVLNKVLGVQYRIEYTLMPWSRAVHAVTSGERELLVSTSPATTPDLAMTEPLGIDRTCFFVRSGSHWTYSGIADLAQQRIGVIRGYHYDNNGPLDQLIASYQKTHNSRLELADGDDALNSNFRKLLAGRMDVVVENDIVGAHTMGMMGVARSFASAGCITQTMGTVHIAVSPKLANGALLLEQINRGVHQLRDSKTLGALLAPYAIEDWLASLPRHP
jgi:polar amino acid transport system substrate-binding protein